MIRAVSNAAKDYFDGSITLVGSPFGAILEEAVTDMSRFLSARAVVTLGSYGAPQAGAAKTPSASSTPASEYLNLNLSVEFRLRFFNRVEIETKVIPAVFVGFSSLARGFRVNLYSIAVTKSAD